MVTSFIISSVIISNHLAHRALEDVRAMEKIFCSNLLHDALSKLSIRNKSDIVGHCHALHHERATSQQFIIHPGRCCTKMMAKHLNEHNITIEMLKSISKQNFDDRQAFNNELQIAGVKRKGWHDNM